ncbi:BA75_03490T0 [Komagataella pastoris]|uniref:BA75_03490T0 n=1 Tax=Komagataella pastoris TaxID=4922 RepID=A0A1B2JFE5_PICPA|nr:BA75_03490T0 [Komagataella pastoris]
MIPLKAKLGLAIVATYSTFTIYISLRTKYEIYKREGGIKDLQNKYSSLTVGGRFENPFSEYRGQTLFEFAFCRILELFEGRTRGGLPSSEPELRKLIPLVRPDMDLLRNNADGHENGSGIDLKNQLTFTWLGQSCSYVQMGKVGFLTDPLFEDFLVNKTLGPKRITPSPVTFEELPRTDYVLVSHNHPDHLEESAIPKIGNNSTWIVPLGLRKYLAKKGIHRIVEMDWWETYQVDNALTVVCLPAMHWSGRKILDTNHSLWCSFLVLHSNNPVFYHAGDTGYTSELFKLIQAKYGPVKLCMLPIGQYCPTWHQKPRHIDPNEAYQIMQDLKAKKMFGVHWGTFVLSSEPFLEPKEKLHALAEKLERNNDIMTPVCGKTYILDMSASANKNEARDYQDSTILS